MTIGETPTDALAINGVGDRRATREGNALFRRGSAAGRLTGLSQAAQRRQRQRIGLAAPVLAGADHLR
jgi:hypothetical protein